jgi:hypothetical protein
MLDDLLLSSEEQLDICARNIRGSKRMCDRGIEQVDIRLKETREKALQHDTDDVAMRFHAQLYQMCVQEKKRLFARKLEFEKVLFDIAAAQSLMREGAAAEETARLMDDVYEQVARLDLGKLEFSMDKVQSLPNPLADEQEKDELELKHLEEEWRHQRTFPSPPTDAVRCAPSEPEYTFVT